MEKDELLGATLILAWVPNSRIQKQDEEARLDRRAESFFSPQDEA